MSDFLIVTLDDREYECCYCKKSTGKHIIMLQCNHTIHDNCLNLHIIDTIGEFIEFVSLDKSILINGIESNTSTIMCLSSQTQNNIIKCPNCNELYSIMSPIYKNFGIPKKIDAVVVFFGIDDYDDTEMYYHHLCTYIDTCHYFHKYIQKNIFNKFEYENEHELITPYFSNKKNLLLKLYEFNEFENHCVFTDGIITIEPASDCGGCDKTSKTSRHASSYEYCNFVYG